MQVLINTPTLAVRMVTTPELCCGDLTNLTTLEEAVQQVSQAYDFKRHPYLLWMQSQFTSREGFLKTQLPFRFAVESFSQALAAVLARISILEERLAIAENVAEEHGHGNLNDSHKHTFQQYLRALGATPEQLESPCSTPVFAFNHSILNYCLTQLPEAGAAALGIIEYLYVDISAAIAHTVDRRYWIAPGTQSHYTIHEKLDVEHARELLLLAKPAWDCPRTRAVVAQGLLLGAHYFWRLYHDLMP